MELEDVRCDPEGSGCINGHFMIDGLSRSRVMKITCDECLKVHWFYVFGLKIDVGDFDEG